MRRSTASILRRCAGAAAVIGLAWADTSAGAPVSKPGSTISHSPIAFDTATARARGRALQEAVRAHDSGTLWRSFSPLMRQNMGDSAGFVIQFRNTAAENGALKRCLTELIDCRTDLITYRAGCEFAAKDAPMILQFSFNRFGEVEGFFIRPQAGPRESKFLNYVTKTPLRLPVFGEWTVLWGGRTVEQNYHAITDDQRFACDLLITRDCVSFKGDADLLESYFAYGRPIVAPAAGKVVWMTNDVKDNKPGVVMTIDPFGNGVVIDHGNGEFSAMAHMKRGSVRVKLGQTVAAGDTIGQCGNSGRTSEPHLNYHLQDGPEPFKGYGLPAQFVRYESDGQPVARGEPTKGERIRRVN